MKRTMKITKKTKSKQAQMERALTTLKKVCLNNIILDKMSYKFLIKIFK